MEELVKELITTIGFPSVIVLGVGLWLRKHLDALMDASLTREQVAAQDRKNLGDRISELENRQYSEITDIVRAGADSQRRLAGAMSALADAFCHAPCATVTAEQALNALKTPVPQ